MREKDQYGEKLYFVDGNTIRRKDEYGEKLYWFESFPERWILACIIKL